MAEQHLGWRLRWGGKAKVLSVLWFDYLTKIGGVLVLRDYGVKAVEVINGQDLEPTDPAAGYSSAVADDFLRASADLQLNKDLADA